MITSLISGFALGFGAAIPLGPINILIMTNALNSYKKAVAIGFGAMSADIIYFFIALYGGLTLAQNITISNTLTILGSIFLLYIAYQIFKSRNNPIKKVKTNTKVKDLLKNYLKGVSLTLLNPYTIAFWLSISSVITVKHLNPQFTVLGIIGAIVCWITLMPLIVYKTKHLISQKVNFYFSLFSALIMAFFAISMLLDKFN